VRGKADSSDGAGVYGSSSGSAAYGVVGSATGTSGWGVAGTAEGTSGIGTYGIALSATGTTTGTYGASISPNGRGVYGRNSSDTGITYGGRFEVDSVDGRAVYGVASATGSGDTPYGVRGQALATTNGYAVYAVGDLGASGLKPFRIDHPSDPENKYLLHYSSESPFPQNFYNGNVVTDANGYAWVELPDYFAQINTNFKYVLTVVDDNDSSGFVQVKVSKKIIGNRFQIRTSVPRVEVSWEVKADRNDARVKARRPLDVQDKVGPERGKYQHPEYYSQPASMGMDYQPRTDARGQNRTVRP
jgi:hypothetical protein